ncbi:MAG: TatD family hydrolase [Spirochaetales bacterium]|nr:TatD family hydrolase [Spirochaetales bacterium]
MKLFDAHCHLHDERLAPDLDAVMERAAAAGVCGFLSCGTEPSDWGAVCDVAERYPDVVPAFGLHPWYLDRAGEGWTDLLETYLAETPSIVGEIGLDTAIKDYDAERQEAAFVAQLAIARKIGLPAVVHCRKAWHRLVPILNRHWSGGDPFVIHSFSGTAQLVDGLAEMGAFFSFSGSLTRRRNKRAHEAAKAVPPERLLIETDAPDIPPVIGHTIDYETPNEPSAVRLVCAAVAELRGAAEEDIAALTWENACRFLDKVISARGFVK